MKASLVMIAALIGTAAVAQTTPDANAPATTPSATSSDASAAPATADAGAAGAVDTSNYPTCSRTVTDKCVQRGAVHKARRHH